MQPTLQANVTSEATLAFWKFAKTEGQFASPAQWERACAEAKRAALDAILRAASSGELETELAGSSRKALEQLPTTLGKLAPELKIPQPLPVFELSGWRVGVSAAIGSMLGMLLMGLVTRIAFDEPRLGQFLGAPVGVFAIVMLSLKLASDSVFKAIVTASLGAVVAGEVLLILAQGNPLARLWSVFSEKAASGSKTRWSLYFLTLLVVLLAKREKRFDLISAESQVRVQVETWVGWLFSNVKAAVSVNTSETRDPEMASVDQILPLLVQLRGAESHHQSTAIRQFFLALSNLGLVFESEHANAQNDSGKNFRLIWSEDLQELYDTFGEITDGQSVEIMKPAVRAGERVKVKGMVRRVFT